MLHNLLIAWCLVSLPFGVGVGYWLRAKQKYLPHPIPPTNARGPAQALKFGFTLDGALTGELIPAGTNPAQAAADRSKSEGKTYGARRI
jgi:hypothetical protein